MKTSKWFEVWFWNKGTYRAYISPADVHNAMAIAWKAYYKGKKDGKKLSHEQLASAEHKGNMKGFKRGRRYGMDK